MVFKNPRQIATLESADELPSHRTLRPVIACAASALLAARAPVRPLTLSRETFLRDAREAVARCSGSGIAMLEEWRTELHMNPSAPGDWRHAGDGCRSAGFRLTCRQALERNGVAL